MVGAVGRSQGGSSARAARGPASPVAVQRTRQRPRRAASLVSPPPRPVCDRRSRRSPARGRSRAPRGSCRGRDHETSAISGMEVGPAVEASARTSGRPARAPDWSWLASGPMASRPSYRSGLSISSLKKSSSAPSSSSSSSSVSRSRSRQLRPRPPRRPGSPAVPSAGTGHRPGNSRSSATSVITRKIRRSIDCRCALANGRQGNSTFTSTVVPTTMNRVIPWVRLSFTPHDAPRRCPRRRGRWWRRSTPPGPSRGPARRRRGRRAATGHRRPHRASARLR